MTSLVESLHLYNGGIVTLVGAGGKTSLMFTLARELIKSGKLVVTTTTTKIHRPNKIQSPCICLGDSADEVLLQVAKRVNDLRHVTVASAIHSSGDKLVGLLPPVVDQLLGNSAIDWVIVEGDGAARKPIKAPAPHEPVIPKESRWVIGIAGLGASGQNLDDRSGQRPHRLSSIAGLAVGAPVTTKSVGRVLGHTDGLLKGSPSKARQSVFLNLAGRPERLAYGRKIAAMLKERRGHNIREVIIGNAKAPPFVVERIEV
jgi:probable selenium-dependent hydroxylase accessory protein YqeC